MTYSQFYLLSPTGEQYALSREDVLRLRDNQRTDGTYRVLQTATGRTITLTDRNPAPTDAQLRRIGVL